MLFSFGQIAAQTVLATLSDILETAVPLYQDFKKVVFTYVGVHQEYLPHYTTLDEIIGIFNFYLNCEHVLFVFIIKQRRKKFGGFSRI